MSKLLYIFIFWIKVVAVVFIFTSLLAFAILVLAGKWNEVSLFERVYYALVSGIANGLLLGTIASIWMGLKTWRVIRMNKKKLARRNSNSSKDTSE